MAMHFRQRFYAKIALLSGAICVSPAMGTQSATPIPDLSGLWGRDIIFYEPPSSGPGPIVNTTLTPGGTMDLLGAWVGNHTSPVLKPTAAEAVRKFGEAALSGQALPNPHNMCWPEAPPFILGDQFGVQILQQKDKVTLLYLWDHKVRHVPLKVSHRITTPTLQGDSIGRYDGDTLVIDTIGIKVGPFSMVDMFGTPHSEALHVIERYRLIDGEAAAEAQRKQVSAYVDPTVDPSLIPFELMSPFLGRGPIDPDTSKKGLQVEFTVEDPVAFTMPWSGRVTYRPVTDKFWPEAVCAENPRLWGSNNPIPMANTPDF